MESGVFPVSNCIEEYAESVRRAFGVAARPLWMLGVIEMTIGVRHQAEDATG